MTSTRYQIYTQKVYQLAGTLSVKYNAIATAINLAIDPAGTKVDYSAPWTWKYYLNLAGLLHPTDPLMVVNAIASGVVTGSSNIVGGSGGTNGTFALMIPAPTVGGVSAQGTFVVSGNQLTAINITDVGSGYVNNSGLAVPIVLNNSAFSLSHGLIGASAILTTANDVVGQIPFTRQSLALRVDVADQYTYNSFFYQKLLQQYPDMQTYINGVIYPIDTSGLLSPIYGSSSVYVNLYAMLLAEGNTSSIAYSIANSIFIAVNAIDGQILSYDASMVESNEYNLIQKIQVWINAFLRRWCLPEYSQTDDLYVPTMLGVLYVNLPGVIMNARLENCKTNQAHSYHVREYLDSNGALGPYADVLHLEQNLWLYRNIRYLQRNVGKQMTFNMILNNLLTPVGLPLAKFDLRHNLSQMPANSIKPTVEMLRTPINLSGIGLGSNEVTVAEIVGMEVPLSRNIQSLTPPITLSRSLDPTLTEATIQNQFANSLSNREATKVLESTVVDSTNDVIYPLAEVLLNNWVYMASTETYSASIYVTNPISGAVFLLNPLDAFLLYVYCYNYATYELTSGQQYEMPFVPEYFGALNIVNPNPPTIAQLESLVNIAYATPALLGEVVALQSPVPLAVPPAATFVSSQAFYTGMESIQTWMLSNASLYYEQEHYLTRGFMEEAVNLKYMDIQCQLSPASNVPYSTWFTDKGIDFTGMTTVDYVTMYKEILQACTGVSNNTSATLSQLQAATLGVLEQLSSYSVQYLLTSNSNPQAIENAPTIRLGDIDSSIADSTQFTVGDVYADLPGSILSSDITVELAGPHSDEMPTMSMASSFNVVQNANWRWSHAPMDSFILRMSQIGVAFVDPEVESLPLVAPVTDFPSIQNSTLIALTIGGNSEVLGINGDELDFN